MPELKTLTLPTADIQSRTMDDSIFFVGNATTLIRREGFTILTDPNFIHKHEKVSIGYGLHATRQTDPAIEFEDLPIIDFVVLSHFHGDHFDQLVEERLDRTLPIITTSEAADELDKRGFTVVIPIDTWDTVEVTKGGTRMRVTATPGRHGPPVVDLALPDVMGSVLQFEDGATGRTDVYITGDTLAIDELREISQRHPDIEVALLHLGGTKAVGIMVTMDGKQGVEVMQMVNPHISIPIHYNDYDRFESPLSDFQAEVERAGLQDRVHYLSHGESYMFDMTAQERRAA